MNESHISVTTHCATDPGGSIPGGRARGTARAAALALLLVLPVAPLLAQEEETPGYTLEVDEDNITLAINENQGLPMRDFITLAKVVTGHTFAYANRSEIEGDQNKINWIGPKTMHKDQFFEFFQTMLYIKDFALVIRGEGATEVYEIIYMKGTKRPEVSSGARYVPHDELGQYQSQAGVQVLTSVPLEHLDSTKASQQLRPFFAASGAGGSGLQFGNAGEKSLLMMGFAPQVYQAYRLLELVDVPEETIDLVIEPRQLEHAAAEELEPLLTELLADRGRQRTPAGSAPATAAATVPLKILAQVTTNTLILSGTREEVAEALDLLAVLDRKIDVSEGNARVVRLRNVLAKDLRETLNQFLTQEKAAEQAARAGQAANAARRPREPVVVADEQSNRLLISAPQSKFAELKSIIDQLDERQRQVLVECAVVELSTTDLRRFGIELGVLDIKDDGDFTRPFGFSHFGQSEFSDTDDDGLPDTRLPDFESPLTGFTGGIISGGDFSIPVLINALQDDSEANVLSLPSVIVNDNQTAVVTSKEERPTQDTQTGTATSTSGFAGFQDAGINLTISPSISSSNYLRLNIDLEVSRFITAFDPNSVSPGVKTTRQIKTQVTLPSGHTMVIGGVIEDSESTSESGVPFLMDIPLLGWLFKTHANDKRKTNLYFFITPHILDESDFSDLEQLSTKKKLEAEDYIGTRRLELVDPKWNPRKANPDTIGDPGATLEALKRNVPFEFPNYRRPSREEPASALDRPPVPGNRPQPVK